MPEGELYLYAVTEPDAPMLALRGIEDAPVEVIRAETCAAVVSAGPSGRLRPSRKNIGAHQSVLRTLLESTSVLPITFGSIAGAEHQVRDLLERFADDLRDDLDRVRGCVEMGFKIKWDVENVFDYIVSLYPDLARARDRVARHGDDLSRDEKMSIGQRVAQCLEEQRSIVRDRAVGGISSSVREFADVDPRTDDEACSLALLVERDKMEAFDSALDELATKFDEKYLFQINGPWAPHNFVSTQLPLGGDGEMAQAA